ncbi:vhs domain-containing protein [Podospora appendiculata]|uniref:Vhs domain-containing protein n=1 Tax=Podospora appendiculata TaxID=314037 RepID=A0AAE0X184_9PEZI|nr:vhs domain-containing protein [Podospora appendiculata]
MFSQKKPYTAVTVTIERLTGEAYPENDLSGIPDLVEVVNLQDTGPTEAARAIRKKLKYGNLHRQLRALTLLDGLIQNAGPRFQRSFADEPLLERLRFCGTADLSDPEVKKKCAELFRSWAADYKTTHGMERVASLYRELPRRKHVVTQEKSKVLKETENPFADEDEEDKDKGSSSQASTSTPAAAPKLPISQQTRPEPRPRTSSLIATQTTGTGHSTSFTNKDKKKKDKKNKKLKQFDLEAEKDHMKANIAEASMAAINLMNTLQSINREKERISENAVAVERFELCKQLRKKILRYIHFVESEQWLGSLLHANDELVNALMTFEQLDRSIDADSDSDDEVAEQAHAYRMATERAKGKEPASPTSPRSSAAGMAGLSLNTRPPPQPPRPSPPPRPSATTKPNLSLNRVPKQPEPESDEESEEEEEDEDDPFADRNAVGTPKLEGNGSRWS